MGKKFVDNGPMLNAYPDSMGGTLKDIVSVLSKKEFEDVFQSFYILPSIFNTDLDRGFSVIDYGINEELGSKEDIDALDAAGIPAVVFGKAIYEGRIDLRQLKIEK
jgi:sucrose phosphorylase